MNGTYAAVPPSFTFGAVDWNIEPSDETVFWKAQ